MTERKPMKLSALAKRIRRARSELLPPDDRSMRALGERLRKIDRNLPGADHHSISRYENEHREPGARWLAAFAIATGCSLEWLFYGIGPIQQPPDENTSRRAIAEVQQILERLQA